MVKYICDHCGKEIPKNERIEFKFCDIYQHHEERLICKYCFEFLMGLLSYWEPTGRSEG